MNNYFEKEDLNKFGSGIIGEDASSLWNKFIEYYGEVFAEGALTAREKALIALAVAHTVQCPYCIDSYTHTALNFGCDQDQIMEAIHVAAAIKAGATLAFGVQSKNISDKLTIK
ncbi:arsenosugar biosynthesis-associated peroxidase-like protein [Peptostreptococcus porci]|uniref:4-carboxymuconolactone decarboxylase n=1 Tax=Peptostreptococcus porci TaxID=2652282 RepID=A0A6N7XF87_9FIRM|nr:arsenosugar biosynthesis-associated peroxidase-like protein [Peptostreptococcus porci]MDY2793783.1 arsenosugar biosynthesis-associated peroxidase-like protein [Peptostreptococcus porci]MDY4128945.1 arsenosugar biosynthesis-associated peroxidase-like protein [Peptostreptococcus porci]MDY4560684.1 arsenosugar biosynthesis-associated peroxidase-like protein [Peptostreptococcus porci]MDY5436575.1 arsenosugar biosynthesis-associated peroxidase-like protein [Peptostreptococcus porci]MDY5479771.1 